MKYLHCTLIALFGMTSAAAWGAGPSVKLAPNTDHPQANDKVSGKGFGAYKAVDIYWDTTDILLATTNGSGSFGSLKYKVPADALPGEHWISAVERGSGTAAQALFTVNTDWAQRGFDIGGKRYNPWENVISPDNVDKLEVAWTYTTGNIVESSPAVVNGVVYIGSNDTGMYALDAITGALKWSVSLDGPVDYSSPAVVNGTAYVGTTSGTMYALDAATGSTKWAHSTGYLIESSPTIANGIVYFGANDGSLYALDAMSGNTMWTAQTTANAQMYSTPAVAKGRGSDGIVYTGSGDHKVYAFDATTGVLLWNASTGDAVFASPAVSDGLIYIGSYDTYLYALNAGTGFAESRWGLPNGIFSSAAVAKGWVYYGTTGGLAQVSRYYPGYGLLPSWSYGGLPPILSSLAVANGVTYVATEASVTALDASPGPSTNLLWSASPGGIVTSSPAIANGMVYVGSQDRNVYAYALNGGDNAVYKRKHTHPPAFATLHPDYRLKGSK